MSTTWTQLRQGSLRIPNRPGVKRPMWQPAPGKKAIGARLGLLPDPQPLWKLFGTSAVLQFVGVILLITVPMLFPQRLIPVMRYEVVQLELPRTAVPLPPEPPKIRPRIQPRPEPEKIEVAPPKTVKFVLPPAPVRPAPPKPRKLDPAEMPKVEPVFETAKIDVRNKQPARPRDEIKTGMIAGNSGSAAPATVNKPLNKVQTGGFGDPDGVAGPGDPNKRANIARKGEYYLPPGPGYGNGTGGANGVRGTVASTGFGNGIAIPPTGGGGGSRQGTVQAGGFADQTKPVLDAPKARPRESGPATQPVEILEKPNPVYSEEARRRRIEGEVLVDVIFRVGGQVELLGVKRGLGFGLDEAAVRAAQRIRFKPALRYGQPVDFPATVHIVFQLAY